MSAPRLVLPIAVSIVGLQAFAIAQTTPPPVESKPPAAQQPPPPGYQQPPPGYQQRPQQPPPGTPPQQPGYPPPPPGYQQPPPGYQQPPQPPPGYQQAPPAYPPGYQPPPGYQQPPPGYYQPPPAYYPPPGYPPGYGYQPAPPMPPPMPPLPPRPPPRTRGFLAMPYLGLATQTGEQGTRYSSGAIVGALIGGRLNRAFSLNGELRVDSLDFRNAPSSSSWSGTELDLGFSPLFHAQFAAGEFVLGPKLSFFTHQESYLALDTSGFTTTYYENWTGWSTGFNAGVFFAVSRFMSLGGMVSYTLRLPTEVCTRMSFSSDDCQSGDYPSVNVLGFHAAALF